MNTNVSPRMVISQLITVNSGHLIFPALYIEEKASNPSVLWWQYAYSISLFTYEHLPVNLNGTQVIGLFCLLCCWDSVSCNPGWLWTPDLSASISQVLGLLIHLINHICLIAYHLKKVSLLEFYVYGCFASVHLCTKCISGALEGQKGVPGPLEQDLHMVVSCHEGAGR